MSVGRLIRYGLPFSNVVDTGVATAPITPGRTIENIRLEMGGTALTAAMLSLIKLKANGKVVMEGSGAQFGVLNAYRGDAGDPAFLDLQFADRTGMAEIDRMVGAFDSSVGIANITAEVTIAGATAPTLKDIIYESARQQSAGGGSAAYASVMAKVLRYPFATSVGGQLPITVPFGPQNGAVIKRAHVFHTGGVIGATVKQDGLVLHESTTAENEREQKAWGRVPQLNVYTIDFVLDGNVSKALDTRDAKSLEWLLTLQAADNGFMVVEYLDALGNL